MSNIVVFIALTLAALPITVIAQRAQPVTEPGVVAMHSNPDQPQEDVVLLLRSDAGPDQNSIYVQAFGERLARGLILVNGQGQVAGSATSPGRIVESFSSPEFDYAYGDASKAYGNRLDKFLRHVIFLWPGCWVVADELAARESAIYTWQFDTSEKPVVEQNRATVNSGNARLLVQFVEPQKLDISVSDQSAVPSDSPWHLKAATVNGSKQAIFLTVLYPYRPGTEASLRQIRRIDAPGIRGVSLRRGEWEDMVLVNRFDVPMVLPNFLADAHIAVVRQSSQGVSSVLLTQTKSLSLNRAEVISSTAPITLWMQMDPGYRSLITDSPQKSEVKLAIEPAEQPETRIEIGIGVGIGGGTSPYYYEQTDPRIFQGTVKVDGRMLTIPEFRYDYQASTITLKLSPGRHKIEIEADPPPW